MMSTLISIFTFCCVPLIILSQNKFYSRYHGTNIHFTNPLPGVLDQIHGPYSIIRMDLTWSTIEKQIGIYDFSNYDILISSLLSHSPPIKPYLIFDYGNPLYQNNEAPSTQSAITAFVNFVISAVSRYQKKDIIWELWNEPNLHYSWKPFPNATAYAVLASAVGHAIKSQFPQEILIGPATAEIDLEFIEQVIKYNNSEVLKHFDAISCHPYRPDNPETVLPRYRALKDLLSKYNSDIPIISGEWGYATCYENVTNTFIPCYGGAPTGIVSYLDQAKFLVRQWVINDFMSIPISIFYDYKNDGDNPIMGQDNFGTVGYEYYNETIPYIPKLSYYAAVHYQGWINDMYQYELIERFDPDNIECIDCKSDQVYVVEYVAEGEAASTLFVAWYANLDDITDKDEKSVNASVIITNGQKYDDKGKVTCYDLFGEDIGDCVSFMNETMFMISNVTSCPVYFTIEPMLL